MKFLPGISGYGLLLMASTVMAAPIYTWQDESGQVHFSDRPLAGTEKSSPVDIPGNYSGSGQEKAADPYSIRQQVEYFDRKKEARRQARLDQQRMQQAAREQALKEKELEYLQAQAENPEPETMVINQYPYYRPYRPYYRPHHPRPRHYPHRRPTIQTTSPYARQYLQRDHSNEFSTHVGSPYPSLPLNFWK